MVSAICPHCHILLVEADDNGFGALGTAENEAVTLGAKVVSNSWGTGEFNGETGWDGDWNHPGVAITFSSGDAAYGGGVQYPSASPYVTSVGGTELTPARQHAWLDRGRVGDSGLAGHAGLGQRVFRVRAEAHVADRQRLRESHDRRRERGRGRRVQLRVLRRQPGLGLRVRNERVDADHRGALRTREQPRRRREPRVGRVRGEGEHASRHHQGQDRHVLAGLLLQGGEGLRRSDRPGHPARDRRVPRAVRPPAGITSVSFTGSPSDPTVTIAGSNLGDTAPTGSAVNCFGGDTGETFGSTGLWISDANAGWTAGQDGDCIGLVLQTWSSTQIVFQFGNGYGHYSADRVRRLRPSAGRELHRIVDELTHAARLSSRSANVDMRVGRTRWAIALPT